VTSKEQCEEVSTEETVEFVEELDASTLQRFLAEIDESLSVSRTPPTSAVPATAEPFIVVTPIGLARRAELLRQLEACGVQLAGFPRQLPWPRASTLLRAHRMHEFGRRRGWYFERVWELLYPGAIAELWQVTGESYRAARRGKPVLRQSTTARVLRVSTPTFSFRTRLHAFHVPDPEDLRRETAALRALRQCDRRVNDLRTCVEV
jgi:hypothetical protein